MNKRHLTRDITEEPKKTRHNSPQDDEVLDDRGFNEPQDRDAYLCHSVASVSATCRESSSQGNDVQVMDDLDRSNSEDEGSSSSLGTGGTDSNRSDGEREFAENLQTIQLSLKKNGYPDVLPQAICAVLNSGGGVVKLKIGDCSNMKKFDVFWQTLEKKFLNSMIRPDTYDDVFDRDVKKNGEQIEVLLFIRAPSHWCTLKSNLYQAQDSQNSEALFLDTFRILNVPPDDELEDKLKYSIQSLPKFPKVFVNEKILKFHESKQIEFKCFKSKNPLLHNNNRSQREIIENQISAFANSSGGIILLGVEDNGTIRGHDLSLKENSSNDVEHRIKLLIKNMKWPCPCERDIHWNLKFFPVKGKENFFVIAIYVAGLKGGVFTKCPESYELRLGEDRQERICKVEFDKWKEHMLCGMDTLQFESIAVQRVTERMNSLSLSKGILLSVKCCTEQILESFFNVGADCPITPEGFVKNLPEEAQKVIKEVQLRSSGRYTHALLVGSRSFLASINNKEGEDVRESPPVGVICDLLLFNSKVGGLHLLTIYDPDRGDEAPHAYSYTTAKALKKILVVQGGCREKFYVTPHVVPGRASEEQQIDRIFSDRRYPDKYELAQDRGKPHRILESLVNVLAVVPSTLSSKLGISFFNLLTKEQFQLVYQEIDRFRELWIQGVAGTGKTFVALEFIKKLRNRDPSLRKEEILFVCENVGLKEQMSTHGVCTCLCRKGFMLKREYTPEKVHHIIMDEVQSFRDEDRCPPENYSWLEFARMLVRQQSKDDDDVGYLWLFIDINQVNHDFPTGIPHVKKQKPSFVLTQVIRNSKRIFDCAVNKIELSTEIKIGHDFEGEEVAIETYQESEQIRTSKSGVQSIHSGGYRIEDIAILHSMQEGIPQDLEHELDLGEIVTAEKTPLNIL